MVAHVCKSQCLGPGACLPLSLYLEFTDIIHLRTVTLVLLMKRPRAPLRAFAYAIIAHLLDLSICCIFGLPWSQLNSHHPGEFLFLFHMKKTLFSLTVTPSTSLSPQTFYRHDCVVCDSRFLESSKYLPTDSPWNLGSCVLLCLWCLRQ